MLQRLFFVWATVFVAGTYCSRGKKFFFKEQVDFEIEMQFDIFFGCLRKILLTWYRVSQQVWESSSCKTLKNSSFEQKFLLLSMDC